MRSWWISYYKDANENKRISEYSIRSCFLPVGLKLDPSFMSDLFPTYQFLFGASLDPHEIRNSFLLHSRR